MGPIPHFRAHSCAGTPGAVSSDYVFAASGKGCLRFANLHLVRQFGDSGGTLLNQQDKFAEMEAGFINWVARLLSFGGTPLIGGTFASFQIYLFMQKVAGSRQEARKLIISGMICLWKTALLLRLDEPMRDHKKIISLVTLEIK